MQSPELASEALRHAAQHNGDRPSPSPDRDRGRGRGWGGQYGVGRAHAYYSSSASLYKLRRFNTLILVVRIVSLCFSLAASIFMALNIHKFGNDTSSNKARWYDYGAFSNYSSFEGVLYCKPHFDQLFKRTGSLDKSFEGTPNAVKNEKLNDGEIKTPNRVSALFSGTQEKCLACGNTVYPIEKVSVEGVGYHKACFKCMHGGCVISPSNYIAIEGRLYCKHHHAQLFKEKGNYSQLIKTPSVKEVSENSVHE